MKLDKTYPNISSEIVEKEWEVPSKSEKGQVHKVQKFLDGHFGCDCIAGQMHRECRHQKLIKETLKLCQEK
jgi:hypothetical protein